LTDREKDLINYKKQYLELVYKITRLRLSGEDPPEKLLKQVQEIGRAVEIPETFLRSI
jgi:hypothetical protein